MYENYTYESILKSILDRITVADPAIDIREGSAMWYAVAPVALELAIAYSNIDMVHGESFVGTATRDGLYNACKDLGFDTSQFEPTAGVFHAHFDVEVAIDSRWSCKDYTFVVTERDGVFIKDGVEYPRYQMVCETLGSHTAPTHGTLKPITEYGLNKLNIAVLDECIIIGSDAVSEDKIRETYFEYVANKSEGANIAQYKQWLNEYGGVGAHKIVPTWNGANTVKVVILNNNKEAPSEGLVAEVQEYLDPNSEGLGEGKAPIGAQVTVEGGVNAHIDVKANLTLTNENADYSDIDDKLTAYFRSIAFAKSVINIYEVASIILSSSAVADVNDVQVGRWINDSTAVVYTNSNLPLSEFETPILHNFTKE